MENLFSFVPFIMLFIIYHKVFRIASDIKEIKNILGSKEDIN